MQLSFGANLHLIHKLLEKPLIYWAFSIKKLSEVLFREHEVKQGTTRQSR